LNAPSVGRLAGHVWGHGYAPEGALAALDFACTMLHLDEVQSWTSTTNLSSQRVMTKIGMTRQPEDDFDHPRLPVGHRLRRHVRYRIRPPSGD
jgi:RimJ/RimL family protein N-acetyltransferase